MKQVVAYIKENRVPEVTLALHDVPGLTGASVMHVRGFGRGRAKGAADRIRVDLIDFLPRIRVEIACQDGLIEEVISAIQQAAHTGLRGDGKIYVSTLDEAVRISSGERGEEAL